MKDIKELLSKVDMESGGRTTFIEDMTKLISKTFANKCCYWIAEEKYNEEFHTIIYDLYDIKDSPDLHYYQVFSVIMKELHSEYGDALEQILEANLEII